MWKLLNLPDRIAGPPHGNCSHTDPYDPDETADGRPYRLISCQKKCLQKGVMHECHCKDIHLPGYENMTHLRFCTSDDDIPLHCRLKATDECERALMAVYDRCEVGRWIPPYYRSVCSIIVQ